VAPQGAGGESIEVPLLSGSAATMYEDVRLPTVGFVGFVCDDPLTFHRALWPVPLVTISLGP
jgi:hypothetical protein